MDLELIKQRAKAFDYLFDALVVTDTQGIITDWNKESESLYGYSREEVLGQPVSLLHMPDDSERLTAQVLESVSNNGRWTGEARMLRKDGTCGWIESMCVPIINDDGTMLGALGINRDISAQVAERERLNHLAYYDQLTQVPNRLLLHDRLTHLINQSERNLTRFGLLYIDLDDFKLINDDHGHSTGDEVLVEVASRLKESIRSSDTLARMVGDRFVVILDKTSEHQDLEQMAETMLEAVKQKLKIDQNTLNITASLGIAVYPDHATNTQELLDAADSAMYRVKRAGKAGFSFYSQE